MSNLDQVYQEVARYDLFLIEFLVSSINLGFHSDHSDHSVQFLPHLALGLAVSQGVYDFDDTTHRRSQRHVIVVLSHPQ